MELHPLCTLFPQLAGAEFDALKADILLNGLRQPIVTHQGFILDGGNRYRACIEAGVEPKTIEFDGGNLVSFVLSANMHRRHLTPGQQAAIVASATDWANAQPQGKPKTGNVAPLSTLADRAATSGASERTQKMADAVAKKSPELAKKVAHGEISLPKAHKQISPAMDADDAPDMAQLAGELQAENEAYQRQIKSLTEVDDKDAELVRLNTAIDQLNGRIHGLTNEKNEAVKMAKRYAELLAKIRKALKVDRDSEILAALAR